MKRWYFLGLLGIGLASQALAGNVVQNVRLGTDQQTLNISLPANATTGFQWFVQSYNHDLLMLQDYHYVPKPAAKGMTGVGGTAVFTFNVDPRFYDAPQITQVNFIYAQPWSPLQSAGGAQVIVSSVESNNDSMDWQKDPQMQSPQTSLNNAVIDSLPSNSAALGQYSTAASSNTGTVTTLQATGTPDVTPAPVKQPLLGAPGPVIVPQAQATPVPAVVEMPVVTDSSNLGTATASVQNTSSSDQWLSLDAPDVASTPAKTSPTAAASGPTAADPTSDDNSQWLSLPSSATTTSSSTSK